MGNVSVLTDLFFLCWILLVIAVCWKILTRSPKDKPGYYHGRRRPKGWEQRDYEAALEKHWDDRLNRGY